MFFSLISFEMVCANSWQKNQLLMPHLSPYFVIYIISEKQKWFWSWTDYAAGVIAPCCLISSGWSFSLRASSQESLLSYRPPSETLRGPWRKPKNYNPPTTFIESSIIRSNIPVMKSKLSTTYSYSQCFSPGPCCWLFQKQQMEIVSTNMQILSDSLLRAVWSRGPFHHYTTWKRAKPSENNRMLQKVINSPDPTHRSINTHTD